MENCFLGFDILGFNQHGKKIVEKFCDVQTISKWDKSWQQNLK